MTDDLTAFLSARLDEDEAVAKAAASAAGPRWHHELYWPDDGGDATAVIFSAAGAPLADTLHREDEEMAAHIARHDPARVLRDVEAKRRLLARHWPDRFGCQYCADGGHNSDRGCADLADLGAIWSDHPDYREEWKP